MLADTGARLSEADSAGEALRRINDDPSDIVLADIAMPGQDGYKSTSGPAVGRSVRVHAWRGSRS
jgi:CheY-like chemotaxis protein